QGDVVGFANLPIDPPRRFNTHAFLWTRDAGIQDLGALPGDSLSEALGINEKRQVVGISCTAGFASCRAFIWQNGVMRDLNDFVPGYPDHPFFANGINDLGWITGQSVRASDGAAVAFVARPARGAQALAAGHRAVPLPPSARDMLLARSGAAAGDL